MVDSRQCQSAHRRQGSLQPTVDRDKDTCPAVHFYRADGEGATLRSRAIASVAICDHGVPSNEGSLNVKKATKSHQPSETRRYRPQRSPAAQPKADSASRWRAMSVDFAGGRVPATFPTFQDLRCGLSPQSPADPCVGRPANR